MRDELAKTSLGTLSAGVLVRGVPASFSGQVKTWFAERQTAREDARLSGMRARSPRDEG